MNEKQIFNILENFNVVVHYQPILCNKSKSLHKHEALMRLTDGAEIILPDVFMQKSKEHGTYNELSKKMILIVFSDLKKYKFLNVSINISMLNIVDIEFCKFLFLELKSIQNLERITLEFIETDKIDFKRAVIFLNELKKIGIKISIDDFGTGYSNFENLLHFDFDYLKIDGQIIKNIHNKKNESIVHSFLSFCKIHDVKIIAEHVENESIYNKVCELDIEFSQGFYVAKPSANLIREITLKKRGL